MMGLEQPGSDAPVIGVMGFILDREIINSAIETMYSMNPMTANLSSQSCKSLT
jgi:hypothetical protein